MKKIILSIFISTIFAVNVTFNVNMSQQDVGDEGPTLWMGHLYPTPGFIMTDEDGDGIWTYTVELPDNDNYTYKYRNGHWTSWNDGSGWEEVPSECEVGDWGDREITVGNEDIVLDIVCFNSCDNECVEVIYSNVTFQVDMSDQDLSVTDVVYVQGSFNGWCGYCNPMSDINGDDIWELTIEIPTGEYEYLFTTQGWDGLNGGVNPGSECDWLNDDSYGNYGFILGEEALLLGPYCFGTCWDTCQPPAETQVTFHVDMSNETIDGNVYMIGNFQTLPWQTLILPTEMEDLDGDGIYSTTIDVLSDELIEYKFVNGDVIESDSALGACGNDPTASCDIAGEDCNNREFQVPSCEIDNNGDCTLDPLNTDLAIFNSCNVVLANVNFAIDFTGTGFPNTDYEQCGLNGSWNASGDDWLGWGLTLGDEDNDNIFTGSLTGLAPGDYEFVIICSGNADGFSGWGHIINAPVGLECDFDSSDEYGNYGFTIVDNSDVNINYCAGSCEETCSGGGGGGTSETYDVTFDIDGVEDCGFVSVTGTFDNWSGWGAHTDNDMTVDLSDGDYEFTILCVDTTNPDWYNDIWSNSTQYQAPWGSECDFIQGDDYPNYGFTVNGANLMVAYCAGSCEETCEGNGGGGTSETYDVTFNIDGLDECGQVNITGTWDDWSGWGVNPADHPDYTISLQTGNYEFIILCVNTAGEWWNDVWANSTIYNAPIDGSCWNGDFDYANYIFTIGTENTTISYCAGSCEETCDSNNECESTGGDVNIDGILNVVDVVAVVNYILTNSSELEMCAADLNNDGIINVVDVVGIVGIILGG